MIDKVFVCSDHWWVNAKEKILSHLEKKYPQIVAYSFWPKDENEKVDYPDMAKVVCKNILEFQDSIWILICWTCQWINMSANKVEWIRSWVVNDSYSAQMIKEHNNANVICFWAREWLFKSYKKLIDIFLSTEFEWGRHLQRVEKVTHQYMNNI